MTRNDDAARERVVEELKERIITGALPPGQRLRERTLSASFGVSRVPIREALFALESQRLVWSEPRRGAFVTALTLTDVHELFDVRAALEPLVGRLAAERRTDGDIAVLTADFAAEKAAAGVGDLKAGSLANSDFHHHLLLSSHNRLLVSIGSPLNLQIQRLFRRTIDGHEEELCQAHGAMLAAVVDHNVALAGQIATGHVEETRQRSLDAADQEQLHTRSRTRV